MIESFMGAKGCNSTDKDNCLQRDELNITLMHRLFGDIRGSLDKNRYHLEQIIKVLYGNVGVDEDVSQQPKTMPDPLPHLCSLSDNLDILRIKIDNENELIGRIYNALGMKDEEKY